MRIPRKIITLNCENCGAEFSVSYNEKVVPKKFCSPKCFGIYNGKQNNKIYNLLKDYHSLKEIPERILKDLFCENLYTITTDLKKYGLSHLAQEYRNFKNAHKICRHCGDFYEVPHSRSQSLCPKEECAKFNSSLKKELVEKVQNTKLEKYGNKNWTNREKYKETCAKRNEEERALIKKKKAQKYNQKSNIEKIKIVEKRKRNILEKYGAEHPLKLDEFKIKQQETNLKKYGAPNPLKSPKIREKLKQTMIKKYGVESSLQLPRTREKMIEAFANKNPEIQRKKKKTFMDRYGVEAPLKNPEIRKKYEKTCLEKYGDTSHNRRHLKNKEDFHCREFWILNFCEYKDGTFYLNRESPKEYFGYNHNILSVRQMKKFGLEFRYSKTENTAETKFVNELEKFLKRKLIRQYPVKEIGLRTRVDAFDPTTNSIYEFLGDYWHGNLEVFEPTKINESTKTSFYELNAKTFIRLNKLKDLGYKVHYIWESDFLKSKFLNLFAL